MSQDGNMFTETFENQHLIAFSRHFREKFLSLISVPYAMFLEALSSLIEHINNIPQHAPSAICEQFSSTFLHETNWGVLLSVILLRFLLPRDPCSGKSSLKKQAQLFCC